MKYFFVLSIIFLAASSFAQVTETPSDTTTVIVTSPTETSTQTAEVTTITEPSTTTAPTTTLSTTSSIAPTSTQTPPTTQSSTTVVTSPKTTNPPSTTNLPSTTNSPITTKAPIPVPEEGSWNVTSGNTTCIRAHLKILFKISFKNGVEEYIALSPNASKDGSNCNSTGGTQVLLLEDATYNLRFTFVKESDSVYVRNTSFTYMLPQGTDTVRNDTQLFSVKTGNSYLCSASDDVIFDNVTMQVVYIKLQAFGATGNTDFGTAEECEGDNPVNDIVPIAVGVALLALVVVVLIAYLVGRRRSRQKGYQSV